MINDKNTSLEVGNPNDIPLKNFDTNSKLLFNDELKKTVLSASGWRKIFVESGNEQDDSCNTGDVNKAIAAVMALAFCDYTNNVLHNKKPVVAVGIDTRPTGPQIADTMIRVFIAQGFSIQYAFITAAPEIMAYSHDVDAFVYISASHNPVGHNGIKFGLNTGGVISADQAAVLIDIFKKRCAENDILKNIKQLITKCTSDEIKKVYEDISIIKSKIIEKYETFSKEVISGEKDKNRQKDIFNQIQKNVAEKPLTIVCDMNGSARSCSIDKDFFAKLNINLHAINAKPRQIVHAIIPEAENLIFCANEMEKLQKAGNHQAILGYMPDCDGDRGNIVFWNEKTNHAEVLKAQEVFALSVLSELASIWYNNKLESDFENKKLKIAVAVNGPTSMRIEEITSTFKATTFRSEVGEANVVNLAREKREEGYIVRILGEGSNGGNITYPAAVRDPLNTIFALLKLLIIRDTKKGDLESKGLFHLWCTLSNQEKLYKDDFSLVDIIETLPKFTTTGVSEQRAIMKIDTENHSELKKEFQNIFIKQWNKQKDYLNKNFGILSYEAVSTNGTKEIRAISDFSQSNRGGLKIIFKDATQRPVAFMWMRGSGTESVFRVMCDVKGDNKKNEEYLVSWEREMISEADRMAQKQI